MKIGHWSTTSAKIDWLLEHAEDWSMIKYTERQLPTPDERLILNSLIDKAVIAGLYSPRSYRRDVHVSLYRAIQRAWAIKRDRTT